MARPIIGSCRLTNQIAATRGLRIRSCAHCVLSSLPLEHSLEVRGLKAFLLQELVARVLERIGHLRCLAGRWSLSERGLQELHSVRSFVGPRKVFKVREEVPIADRSDFELMAMLESRGGVGTSGNLHLSVQPAMRPSLLVSSPARSWFSLQLWKYTSVTCGL